MSGPEIHGIKFDGRSREGLLKIKDILSRTQVLTNVIFSSVWLLILIDPTHGLGRANDIAYNVSNTEWDSWKAALKAAKQLTRDLVYKEADLQAFDHNFEPKQYAYWSQVKREAAQ